MPSASDLVQFFRGQIFETPVLPTTNLQGKTVVIIGANTGLGFECAKHLALLGVSTLVLACRSMSKGEAAKDSILSNKALAAGTTVHVWQIDMANYSSVMALAERMRVELPRVDALIANAGISTKDYVMAEDCESTLTVNVVSTFLLALLALPQLEQTADETGAPTRLTIVGSAVHIFAAHGQLQSPPRGKLFQTLSDRKTADMGTRYFLSKLMVTQCTQELAKKTHKRASAAGPKVVINCPNPGWCKTGLFRNDDGGAFARAFLRMLGRTGEVGARTLAHAVIGGDETHGQYLSECRVKPASTFVRSQGGERLQVRVWTELLNKLEAISPGVTRVLD